jgi:malonyl-CoA O-methyltransferase
MPETGIPAIDARAARRAYARAASTYASADVLAREIERRMLERLEYVRLQPKRVLDAGSGTGAGAKLLAARYPQAQLIELDFALPMLRAARGGESWLKRAFARAGAHRLCADFGAMPIRSASLGLVWSNLALHCCAEPLPVFKEMHRVLEVGGLLMFSSYGPDTLKELKNAFGGESGAFRVHGFSDLHDLGDMLVASGFAEPVMDMEMVTLTYDHTDRLLADLRASGQVNALASRRRGLTGRDVFSAMRGSYEALRREGRLPASFEIVYGHAWKVEPRFTADGRSFVKLEFPRARVD